MNDYQMSQRQDELINNVLDEGINEFMNINQTQYKPLSQYYQSNSQMNNLNNNSYINNLNNNSSNYSIEPYRSHNRNYSNYSNSSIGNQNYSYNNMNKNYTPNIKQNDKVYSYINYDNKYKSGNQNYSQYITDYSNPDEIKRLDDNVTFLNNLRNITSYSNNNKIYNDDNNKIKSERVTENEINNITKKLINMQEKLSNIPLSYEKKSDTRMKKSQSNKLFKKSQTLSEEKIKQNIIDKKYANANIEDLKRLNELYSPENFEKNNFDLFSKKPSKKLSQNEIWKEKYEMSRTEFNNLYKILEDEKKKNKETEKHLKKMRNKEKKLSDLQILNGKLYEARENIEDKLKQSENIRAKQSELISKLQNEIEQMRKIIRMKTPL